MQTLAARFTKLKRLTSTKKPGSTPSVTSQTIDEIAPNTLSSTTLDMVPSSVSGLELEPGPDPSQERGMLLHNLPAELQYLIYLVVLPDLEMKIVPESNDPPSSKSTIWKGDYRSTMYILSSSSLSHLYLYQEILFPLAKKWRSIRWESHVKFVFPTALSLLDVLTSPSWPPERLSLIRKLRLYEHQIYHFDQGSPKQHEAHQVLSFLAYRGLTLILLEFAPFTPLKPFSHGFLNNGLKQILETRGWSILHIISIPIILSSDDIRSNQQTCAKAQDSQYSIVYVSDLPATPYLLWELTGQVVGLTYHDPPGISDYLPSTLSPPSSRFSVPAQLGRQKWLEEKHVHVQMVVERLEDMRVTEEERNEPHLLRDPRLFGHPSSLVGGKEWVEMRRKGEVKDCVV